MSNFFDHNYIYKKPDTDCKWGRLYGQQYPIDLNKILPLNIKNFKDLKSCIFIEKPYLIALPFKIKEYNKYYINPEKLVININELSACCYEISIIQNFQIEDCNPDLSMCMAGIFLGENLGNYYCLPEEYPTESRTIKKIGWLNILKDHVYIEYKGY